MIKFRFVMPKGLNVNSQLTKLPVRTSFLFGPGVFLVLLGLATVIAPSIILGLVAGFCIFFGVLALYLAYRFIKIKKTLEGALKDLQSRVMVQSVQPTEFWTEDEPGEPKKYIIH